MSICNRVFITLTFLLFLITLGISISSFIIYNTTSDSNYEAREIQNCYNNLKTGLSRIGISFLFMASVISVFLGCFVFIMVKNSVPEKAYMTLLIPIVFTLISFALIAMALSLSIGIFDCSKYSSMYKSLWVMNVIIFSVCISVIGISLLALFSWVFIHTFFVEPVNVLISQTQL